jgi:hypothetical protein
MESIAPGTWPWLVLVGAAAGFVLGYLFGRPRMLAGWGPQQVCPARCNCGGINCILPPPGGVHVHCARAGCGAGCTGGCTLAPHAANVPHSCSHGHVF